MLPMYWFTLLICYREKGYGLQDLYTMWSAHYWIFLWNQILLCQHTINYCQSLLSQLKLKSWWGIEYWLFWLLQWFKLPRGLNPWLCRWFLAESHVQRHCCVHPLLIHWGSYILWLISALNIEYFFVIPIKMKVFGVVITKRSKQAFLWICQSLIIV